jgi:hypothetical protein
MRRPEVEVAAAGASSRGGRRCEHAGGARLGRADAGKKKRIRRRENGRKENKKEKK